MRTVDPSAASEGETGDVPTRAKGGAPALRCGRFAGDPVLLAVLAGRMRLAARGTSPSPSPIYRRGPAVRKVQEALVAVGYGLPRYGSDGIFGRETGAAVTRFKVDQQIRPPGPVVEAATMRALDRRCSPRGAGGGPLSGVRVAVVGGGFAGLMAAWSLQGGGMWATVFEATGRLGGRVRTDSTLIPGKVVEAGAELIGRNHPTWNILKRTLGLALVPVSRKGDHRGLIVRLRFGDTDISEPDQERIDRELEPVLQRIGREARDIHPLRPWAARNALDLDRKSVADRIGEPDMFGPRSSLARHYFEFVTANDQCASLGRQSYLGFLAAVSAHRLGGDMLGYWKHTETHRCRGGNEQLASRLAGCQARRRATENAGLCHTAHGSVRDRELRPQRHNAARGLRLRRAGRTTPRVAEDRLHASLPACGLHDGTRGRRQVPEHLRNGVLDGSGARADGLVGPAGQRLGEHGPAAGPRKGRVRALGLLRGAIRPRCLSIPVPHGGHLPGIQGKCQASGAGRLADAALDHDGVLHTRPRPGHDRCEEPEPAVPGAAVLRRRAGLARVLRVHGGGPPVGRLRRLPCRRCGPRGAGIPGGAVRGDGVGQDGAASVGAAIGGWGRMGAAQEVGLELRS